MNRVNLICLGVKDVKRSLEFYKSIGFKTSAADDVPAIVFFNNQGSKLELYQIDALAKDIDADNPPSVAPGAFSGITLACNMKSRAEVDAAMLAVKKCGGVVVKEPQDVFWGGYSGYFKDPDGYYWELAYAEIWNFDANGMLIIE